MGERTVGTGRVPGLLSRALGDVVDSDPPIAIPPVFRDCGAPEAAGARLLAPVTIAAGLATTDSFGLATSDGLATSEGFVTVEGLATAVLAAGAAGFAGFSVFEVVNFSAVDFGFSAGFLVCGSSTNTEQLQD
jgi:hypothetical protein